MSVKREVPTCPTCGGKRWVMEGPAKVSCFTCGGTGQVIGVPKGKLLLVDGDTRASVEFEKMGVNEPRKRLEALNPLDDGVAYKLAAGVSTGIHEEPAAVVNLVMDGAKEEDPDASV